MTHHHSSKYQWAALALLGVGVVAELTRVVFNAPWGRFEPLLSHMESGLVAGVFALAAVSLPLRERSAGWARIAWFFSFLAPFTMFAHGVLTLALSHSELGAIYGVAAPILVLLLKRVWDGEDFYNARHVS